MSIELATVGRIPTTPDLPPSPASWAVPASQNITRPRLLLEKLKRREDFQLGSKVSSNVFIVKKIITSSQWKSSSRSLSIDCDRVCLIPPGAVGGASVPLSHSPHPMFRPHPTCPLLPACCIGEEEETLSANVTLGTCSYNFNIKQTFCYIVRQLHG